MRARYFLLLLALGSVWGASFLFIKVIVAETSPIVVAEGRLFFGALAVAAVILWRRLPFNKARAPAFLLQVALLAILANILPFLLISWSEVHIDSGLASVLNSSMPLFTVVFTAAFLPQEGLSLTGLAGLLVGFLGVIVLTGGDILSITEENALGELAVVGAAACYALGAVFARNLLRSESPLSLSGLQLGLGTLLLAPALLAVDGGRPDFALSAEAWGSLLTLGILGTGIAYIVYLRLLETIGPVRSSLVTYIVPVMGLFLGWAVLDEEVGVNTLFGCGLIIAGIAIVARARVAAMRDLPATVEGKATALLAGEGRFSSMSET